VVAVSPEEVNREVLRQLPPYTDIPSHRTQVFRYDTFFIAGYDALVNASALCVYGLNHIILFAMNYMVLILHSH
jgi:hypothetical protein